MRGFARWARASLREQAYSLACIGYFPPSALGARRRASFWRHGRGFFALAGAIGLIAAAALRLEAPSHGMVAVFFPPWVDTEQALERVARSGGLVVETSAHQPWLVLAIAADRRFMRAVRREGAVLILDGAALREAEDWVERRF